MSESDLEFVRDNWERIERVIYCDNYRTVQEMVRELEEKVYLDKEEKLRTLLYLLKSNLLGLQPGSAAVFSV